MREGGREERGRRQEEVEGGESVNSKLGIAVL